jgi:hypothetical protein
LETREFSILGQKLVITDPAQVELAAHAVQIVHAKVEEIRAQKPLWGPQQISILALLEIAGSLVRERQSIDAYRKELDRRCSDLMSELSRLPPA